MMVVEFPLIRWKMFETYLEDVDEAVEQIRNNRYSSVIEHLGLEYSGKHTSMSSFSGSVSTDTNSFLLRVNRS
jgi:hypothetical protein